MLLKGRREFGRQYGDVAVRTRHVLRRMFDDGRGFMDQLWSTNCFQGLLTVLLGAIRIASFQ